MNLTASSSAAKWTSKQTDISNPAPPHSPPIAAM
jgi:hypothetical protein